MDADVAIPYQREETGIKTTNLKHYQTIDSNIHMKIKNKLFPLYLREICWTITNITSMNDRNAVYARNVNRLNE